MLFSLIHKNSPYIIFIYPVLFIILFISHILHPIEITMYYDANPMPLYAWITQLHMYSKYIWYGVILLFMLMNAFLLSRIQVLFRIIDTATAVPILLYFLLSASSNVFQQCNPLHAALTFLLISIISIFKMYKNEQSLQPVFEAGFMLALASMFYANMIFYAVFLYIALFVLVPFNWRQWISLTIGILTPFIIVSSIYFLQDQLYDFFELFVKNTFIWQKSFSFHYEHFIFFGFLALIFIFALFHTFSGSIKKVATKKYYSLFFIFMLVTTGIFFLVPAAGKEIVFFLIIPLAFIIGNYLENIRSRFWQELIFTLIVIGVILIQVFE